MQQLPVTFAEAWPFLGALLLLGWAFLGFVSQ